MKKHDVASIIHYLGLSDYLMLLSLVLTAVLH